MTLRSIHDPKVNSLNGKHVAMRIGLGLARRLLFLAILFTCCVANAMDMPSYDLTSLVYLSTDIVVANISGDRQHTFIATVSETLHGSIKPGERLETLTPFLSFFYPMKDGLRVILFLDRRPIKYDFLYEELATSPFAVPPSGVYLIDGEERVHVYRQENNPGGYIASGYSEFSKQVAPGQSARVYPTLGEIRAEIAASVKAVDAVRPLLEKTATPADVPTLLKLVDRTSPSRDNCELRMAKAITDQVISQIQQFNDADTLLRAITLLGTDAVSFEVPRDGKIDPVFAASRERYLLRVMADRNQDTAVRRMAAQALINSYSHVRGGYEVPLQLDDPAVVDADSAREIRVVTKGILDDENQDEYLRALCVHFLSLGQPVDVDEARQVYARTNSEVVKYAIEVAFQKVSQGLYQSLKPASRMDPSIVDVEDVCGCDERSQGPPLFIESFHLASVDSEWQFIPVFEDLKTGLQFHLKGTHLGTYWNTAFDGQAELILGKLSDVPPGVYSLFLEDSRNDNTPGTGKYAEHDYGTGYGIRVRVRESASGKEVEVLQPALHTEFESGMPGELR
jgi:hypothetical protein